MSPTGSQRDPDERQRRRCPNRRRQRRRDSGQAQRACEAVEQGDSVQEERRRERAEQEVLERRLLGEQAAAPGKAAHQIQRKREDLQRDEHRQQVVRRRGRAACRPARTSSAGRLPSVPHRLWWRPSRRDVPGTLEACAVNASRPVAPASSVSPVTMWRSAISSVLEDSDQEQGALQEQRGLVHRRSRRRRPSSRRSRAGRSN